MNADLVLVDSGGSNIGSLQMAFARLGITCELSRDASRIRSARHVVLPGVGAAGPAMRRLQELNLVDTLRNLRQPVLGICLGMQLLFARSEEADVECLAIIDANVRKMNSAPGIRVPHMGWNRLEAMRDHAMLSGIQPTSHAYFVHSYAAECGAWTLARTHHGAAFSALVRQDNFHGAQFHPERSGQVGATLLRNFVNL
ncbi:MAG: imidazole glycerol phosphate synthase subunit HisH [Tahibacter sp.]